MLELAARDAGLLLPWIPKETAKFEYNPSPGVNSSTGLTAATLNQAQAGGSIERQLMKSPDCMATKSNSMCINLNLCFVLP